MKRLRTKQEKRIRRHTRIKAQIKGTGERPRLSVFRSNRFIWVQLIDDVHHKTIASATDWHEEIQKGSKAQKDTRLVKAERIGKKIGVIAAEKNITACIFDRGGYKYHGRIKAVADGMRKAGIKL